MWHCVPPFIKKSNSGIPAIFDKFYIFISERILVNLMRLPVALALLWQVSSVCFGCRILAYFPTPAPSHHFFFQPILRALGQQGHQVDYYTSVPMRDIHPNVTIIQLELSMEKSLDEIDAFDNWKLSIVQQMKNMWKVSLDLEKAICRSNGVQKLLSSNVKYDLLLHEGMFWLESSNIFKHKFNVPSVALLAVGDFVQVMEFSGLEINPSYMVNGFSTTTDRMNFIERLQNAFAIAGILYSAYRHLERVQEIVDGCLIYREWESRPPLSQLISDQALILVNNHPGVGYPFPKPPHYKEIGGAVLMPRKPLPQDLEKFINESKYGIIYFSLGTLVDFEKAVPHLKEIFTKVLSSRKQRVLWKWNGEPWEGVTANVLLRKWFPQQDILAHKNVRLFITHGGLESYFEAVYFGVPIVSIACFADQIKNSLAATQHGYGVRLALDNITEASLQWALDETLNEPGYKSRVLEGSKHLKDGAMSPVDEGVYWIEYVLRHGNVLQPEGARMSFIKFHCLDVYAFAVMCFLVVTCFTKFIFSSLYIFITHKISTKEMKKKKM